MAVRPETLETPERDLSLEMRPGPRSGSGSDASDSAELARLRGRLGDLKLVRPPGGLGCRDCWDRGRLAIIAEVEPAFANPKAGEEPPPAGAQLEAVIERLERARTMEPRGLHWRECWVQGRDAAIAAIEGA